MNRQELIRTLENWLLVNERGLPVPGIPENHKHRLLGDRTFREAMEPVVRDRLEFLRRLRTPLVTPHAAELRKQPCTYCDGPGGTVDHVVPVLLGGSDDPENLVPACQSCNSRKGAKVLEEFLDRGDTLNP